MGVWVGGAGSLGWCEQMKFGITLESGRCQLQNYWGRARSDLKVVGGGTEFDWGIVGVEQVLIGELFVGEQNLIGKAYGVE